MHLLFDPSTLGCCTSPTVQVLPRFLRAAGVYTSAVVQVNLRTCHLAQKTEAYRARSQRLGLDIIRDNLAPHKTKRVEAFLGYPTNVKLRFTPTYSSWLNQSKSGSHGWSVRSFRARHSYVRSRSRSQAHAISRVFKRTSRKWRCGDGRRTIQPMLDCSRVRFRRLYFLQIRTAADRDLNRSRKVGHAQDESVHYNRTGSVMLSFLFPYASP